MRQHQEPVPPTAVDETLPVDETTLPAWKGEALKWVAGANLGILALTGCATSVKGVPQEPGSAQPTPVDTRPSTASPDNMTPLPNVSTSPSKTEQSPTSAEEAEQKRQEAIFALADRMVEADGDPEALDAIIKKELPAALLENPKLYAEAVAKLYAGALATATAPGVFQAYYDNEYKGGGDLAEMYKDKKVPEVLAILKRFNGGNTQADKNTVEFFTWRAATALATERYANSMTPPIDPAIYPSRFSVDIESKVTKTYRYPDGELMSVTVATEAKDSFSDKAWVAKFQELRVKSFDEREFSPPFTVKRQDHYNVLGYDDESGLKPNTHITTKDNLGPKG